MVELGAFCLLMAIACYGLDLWGRNRRKRNEGRWLRRLAVISSGGAALALLGALIRRALESGHWPFATAYEFALAFACSAALIHLLWECRDGVHTTGAFTLAPVLGLILWAQFSMPPSAQRIQPLPPALRSIWFPLHVVPAALSYGAFALSGGVGAMRLLWPFGLRGSTELGEVLRTKPWLEGRAKTPETDWMEALITRGVTFGYPWLSAAMILGMVWAQMAWGSYWSWDVKEVWTLVTWLFYTLFLHLRLLRGWRGRRMGWLALIGLGLVLFTFTGVGWLARRVGLESLHVF